MRTLRCCNPLLVFFYKLVHVRVFSDRVYDKDCLRVFGASSYDIQIHVEGIFIAICVGDDVGELGIGVTVTWADDMDRIFPLKVH